MGHGTEHHVNPVYAALDYMFKDLGYENVHVGTVEAYPSLESALRLIRVSGDERDPPGSIHGSSRRPCHK